MTLYRKAISSDIRFLFQCYNEKNIAEKASLRFEDDYSEFEQEYLEILWNQAYHLYIIEAQDGPIGFIQIRETDKDAKTAEGSVWLGRKRNMGFGIRTFQWMFEIAFDNIGYQRVWGWVRENNEAMNRICRKFGLRLINSCERPAWKIHGVKQIERIYYYEVTSADYKLKQNAMMRYGRIKTHKAGRSGRAERNPTSLSMI